MPIKILQASVAIALALVTACGGGVEEARPAPPPDARRVDQARTGTIAGRVVVEGPMPSNAAAPLDADAMCARAHPGGFRLDTFVVNDGGLDNVFVYVKDGLDGYYFEAPTSPVTLDQQGCRYVPHVFGVQAGQPIEIVNSDATMHNVHAVAKHNPEFNFGQPIQGMKNTVRLANPEVMVQIVCNVHNWMSAYAGVVGHPYYAVTSGGGFELKNVPPGTYTVEAWHEKLGTQTQQVTLAENDAKTVTFTFKSGAATN
jgi:plastocyanin